ncbi:MAG TPA: R3H domain-containing nucleic acid-binding protein [Anaerolineae bacterium]|jgi:stage III sporulation protein SpoIIIAA|nr:R3H domain-containing nucleic acid-binding protein [Anaerolineae bacterium]
MNEDQKQLIEDLRMLLAIVPGDVRAKLEEVGHEDELLEVVLDLGRRPAARYVWGEKTLRESEVTREEIDAVVASVGDFDDDNRAGIARTLHRIAAIRNRRSEVVGLTCRVGRAVYGTINIIADLIDDGESILLLGRPGVGKTTMLREMARVLSGKKRVIIVDTSNEIGGDGDIPHPAVGRARRMQVAKPAFQHETMIEAVENHNPEVIIIDEIGREREAAAARTINERGVQLIGTAHGNTIENLLLNPTLSDLVGGIESVTLSDEEARRRGTQKTVLERRAPPTFDILIEIQDRQRLAIHRNVASSVDSMLRGHPLGLELRYRDEDGEVQVEQEEAWKVPSPEFARRRDARGPNNGQRQDRPRQVKGSQTDRRLAPSDRAAAQGRHGRRAVKVFAYGVARNRLLQAARSLNVSVEVVNDLDQAEVMVTLKSYFRRQRKLIIEAQNRRVPVYVLRANTITQMENFLIEALGLEVTPADPFEQAIAETEKAIQLIQSGQNSVDLAPVSSAVRRYQHQMARQANLVSHSYGKGANRHVRIFRTPRNQDAAL